MKKEEHLKMKKLLALLLTLALLTSSVLALAEEAP